MPDSTLQLSDIEANIANADRIAAQGKDRDNALTVLAKGMSNGMAALLELVKGKRAELPPEEPPADGGEDDEPPAEGEGEGEGEDEGEDGKPGFEDMRMGEGAGDEYVDATEYVLGLQKQVARQGSEIKALRKAVNAGNGDLRAIRAELGAFVEAYAATTVPMAKGMLSLHESLLELPAAVHNPGYDARRAAVRQAVNNAGGDAPNGIDVVKLTKGLKSRIIDENQSRAFKLTGRFVDNEAENAALVERVAAL